MINTKRFFPVFCLLMAFIAANLFAMPKVMPKKDKNQKGNSIQRTAPGAFDLQKNTVSNIEFYTTNYGIFGYNVETNEGGGYWPRNTKNQYIFAGGIWFGGVKNRPDTNKPWHYVEISYYPNNGRGWMVPGVICPDCPTEVDLSTESVNKYKAYFSTDYNSSTGEPSPLISDKIKWPIWDISEKDTLKMNRYFGGYVDDINMRDVDIYKKGPAFISGEDIFCVFKDTDLKQYDGGAAFRRRTGYPLRLQTEHTIYSWGFGDYKDFIFLRYDIIYKHLTDTLMNCWVAPVMDVDIALAPYTSEGAANDRVMPDPCDSVSLNLGVQWSETRNGAMEKDKGFGYLGFDFLESPAVYKCSGAPFDTLVNDVVVKYCSMCVDSKDTLIRVPDPQIPNDSMWVHSEKCIQTIAFPWREEGFIRKDRRVIQSKFQLGLRTFRNWVISDDIPDDPGRYNLMSMGVKDPDNGEAGDKRFMMATGPFNFRPGDTARVVVGMILANPSLARDADGTCPDMAELIRKDIFAQSVYDNNFQAPTPPDRGGIKWQPLNNAIRISWDTVSEYSKDIYERGLDFMGYKLYRARRNDLDTFDLSNISPDNKYPSGKGPFGWKEIGHWRVPTAYYKSVKRAGSEKDLKKDTVRCPMIDSMVVAGPVYDPITHMLDSNSIAVLKIPRGVYLDKIREIPNNKTSKLLPSIYYIDTSVVSTPWGKYYSKLANIENKVLSYQPIDPSNTLNGNPLIQNVMLMKYSFNQAYIKFNPLFYKKYLFPITYKDTQDVNKLVSNKDTIYDKSNIREILVDGVKKLCIDVFISYPLDLALADSNHLAQVMDTIYKYIQEVKYILPPKQGKSFEDSSLLVASIISPYMKDITDQRVFVDVGDDDHSGKVEFNENPLLSEKLINNVDYYYKLLAYDEGDYYQPTNQKYNEGQDGLPNYAKTYPRCGRTDDGAYFEILPYDTLKMGGLYNFKFYPVNSERCYELFAGDTLELEFAPYSGTSYHFPFADTIVGKYRMKTFGLYQRTMTLRDLNKNKTLYYGATDLEATLCNYIYRTSFTEDAASYILADTLVVDSVNNNRNNSFGLYSDRGQIIRSGNFNTGEFGDANKCYAVSYSQEAFGTFGFGFDYAILQQGGRYRGDSIIKPAERSTPVSFIKDDSIIKVNKIMVSADYDRMRISLNKVLVTQWVFSEYPYDYYATFNNGPANYKVTFKEGGLDTLVLGWNKTKTKKFIVPYLTMEVENDIGFVHQVNETTTVKMQSVKEVPFMTLPDTMLFPQYGTSTDPMQIAKRYYPDPRNLKADASSFIGKCNMSAYGWVNGRFQKDASKFKEQQAWDMKHPGTDIAFNESKPSYVGKQNRYYKSAVSIDGVDTVDFTNILQASGVFFAFDFANHGRRFFQPATPTSPGTLPEWSWAKDSMKNYKWDVTTDFIPGDVVYCKTTGGALGFPAPGAKIKCVVKSTVAEQGKLSDSDMEKIKVVPNPYLITHMAQRSPYDARLYFTKLPKICTIKIFTSNGDLVKQINHNETDSYDPTTVAVEVWDLLSKNKQRIQSQTLIAYITTPDGAQTVKNFSVIVGSSTIREDKE